MAREKDEFAHASEVSMMRPMETWKNGGEDFVSILALPEKANHSLHLEVHEAAVRMFTVESMGVDELTEGANGRWRDLARGGVHNGRKMRLANVHRDERRPNYLRLNLATTNYKAYLFSRDPEEMAGYGLSKVQVANPLNLCSVVVASGGEIMGTIRTSRNEIYAGRRHAIGGGEEGGVFDGNDQVDLVGSVKRELYEEAGILPQECTRVECVGLVYDELAWHPELNWVVRVRVSASEIRRRQAKNTGEVNLEFVRGDPQALLDYVSDPNYEYVPTGLTNFVLAGRYLFGREWYEGVREQMVETG